MGHPLVSAIRAGLADAAEPCRAPAMQQYMKSEMPFYGVQMTVARPLYRALIKAHPISGRDGWEQVIRELYDQATHREERYGALAVLAAPRYHQWLDRLALPLFEHMIRTGAWWDLVDDASSTLGVAFSRDPDGVRPRVREWAHGEDLWLARAAIICQRKARGATDVGLLGESIEASTDNPDFFARKAIGWALREYSKTDAAWVRAFVESHPGLSPLSRREALRRLG